MGGLQFDWETVTHQSVVAIIGRSERKMDDGSLVWDTLAFVLSDSALVLTANGDSDEIIVAHDAIPTGHGWVTVAALDDIIGKPLGWCWVGTNYRGYTDSFTLAFGNVVPEVMEPRLTFLGEGSAITCFSLMSLKG